MGRSADFPTTNGNIYYYIQVDEGKSDVSNNSTSVTVSLRAFKRGTSIATYGNGTAHLAINGNSYSATIGTDHRFAASVITLISKTVNVKHGDDGKKRLQTAGYISHNRFSSTSQSYAQDLTSIPRASIPTMPAQFWIGDSFTLTTNRKSSNFTHNIFLKVNGSSVGFFGAVGSSVEMAPNIDSIYRLIPDTTMARIDVTVHTFDSGTPVGQPVTRSIYAYVPSDVVPGFSHIEVSDTNTTVSGGIGEFVQGLSRMEFEFILPQGVQYSKIIGYELKVGTFTSNKSTTESIISQAGTLEVTGTVTDSRGREGSKTKEIELLPYIPPKVTKLQIERARSDGVVNMLGAYAKVHAKATMFSLKKNGVERNKLSYKVESRVRGTTTWSTGQMINVPGGVLDITKLFSGYLVDKTYDFRVVVQDLFNLSISLGVMTAGGATMSWGVKGVGLGKVHERGALDVLGDTYIAGDTNITGETTINGITNITGDTTIKGKTVTDDGEVIGTLEVGGGIRPQQIFTPSIYNYWKLRNGWAPPRVIKDADGWVHIEGVVEGGTGDRILRLPEGMRPNHGALTFLSYTYHVNTTRIDVRTDGNVVVFDHTGFTSFSGIKFYVGDGNE